MDKTQLEIRNISGNITRAADDSRYVEGYAIVFNSRSEDLGFIETIDRDAISQEMINGCDVFALFNHDDEKVLARSNKGSGSLHLEVDDIGLRYSFDAPNTDLGNTLLEYLKRGDITGSSFAFYVDWDDHSSQTWETKNGIKYRTIHKISYIHDVSPVFCPAYSATSVSKRAIDKIDELNEMEKRQAEQEQREKEEIINKLDNIIAKVDNTCSELNIDK